MALVHYELLLGLRICPYKIAIAVLGIVCTLIKQNLSAAYTNSILYEDIICTLGLEVGEINDMYIRTAVLESGNILVAYLNSSSLACT